MNPSGLTMNPAFQQIKLIVSYLFSRLPLRSDGRASILESLSDFESGKSVSPFSFSLMLEQGRDLQWLAFIAEEDSITVTEGGFVYASALYGDTYSDWTFTIWQDGQQSGTPKFDMSSIENSIRQGARLHVTIPETE